MDQPDSIGIRELRQNASQYIAMAKAGSRVPVTERGKLVAYLVPAEGSGSVLDRLEAAGQYRRGVGNLMDHLPPPAREPGEKPLSEVLQEMRDEEQY